jgi:uncharacterized protein YpmS
MPSIKDFVEILLALPIAHSLTILFFGVGIGFVVNRVFYSRRNNLLKDKEEYLDKREKAFSEQKDKLNNELNSCMDKLNKIENDPEFKLFLFNKRKYSSYEQTESELDKI